MSAPDDGRIRAPHPRLRPSLGDYVGYDISGVPAGTP
ncbi:AraC family transcriptional regulator, partial [Burkholderia multivorans]